MSDKLLKLFIDDFINSKLICYFSNFLLNFMIRDRVNFHIYILKIKIDKNNLVKKKILY
jgi:hypothetical protein